MSENIRGMFRGVAVARPNGVSGSTLVMRSRLSRFRRKIRAVLKFVVNYPS